MSIDAMKQALEALEECIGYKTSPFMTRECDAAITALRAAIEQANEFNPDWDALAVMVEEQQRMAKRIDELEAQQKPWVKTYAGGKPNYTVPEEPGVTLDASAPLVVQPHPAFKKWQGLTADEIWDEWCEQAKPERDTRNFVAAFARAIEAKLREKNT